MDGLFPTLFSKTFFIVGTQLTITWLATHFVFCLFNRGGEVDGTEITSNLHGMRKSNPGCAFLFSPSFIGGLLLSDIAIFLTLLFWGVHQILAISFTLFSIWSIITGVELEYTLINVDHGLGRRVLALTATIVFATALIGIYSHVNFGYLQIPLFIALCLLLLGNVIRIVWGMDSTKQRLMSICGVIIFTLYLVFDFNALAQKNASESSGWSDGWSEAMQISIKIYLDIINLFLQLLQAMSKHH